MKIDGRLYIIFLLFFRLYSTNDDQDFDRQQFFNLDIEELKNFQINKELISKITSKIPNKTFRNKKKVSLDSLSEQVNKLSRLTEKIQKNMIKLAIDVQDLSNRFTRLDEQLNDLRNFTDNIPLIILLNDINTTISCAGLRTPLAMYESVHDTDCYNNSVKNVLHTVQNTIYAPLQNNILLAQAAVDKAINCFENIMSQDDNLSVASPHSLADIHICLMKLKFQLLYLYSFLYESK